MSVVPVPQVGHKRSAAATLECGCGSQVLAICRGQHGGWCHSACMKALCGTTCRCKSWAPCKVNMLLMPQPMLFEVELVRVFKAPH